MREFKQLDVLLVSLFKLSEILGAALLAALLDVLYIVLFMGLLLYVLGVRHFGDKPYISRFFGCKVVSAVGKLLTVDVVNLAVVNVRRVINFHGFTPSCVHAVGWVAGWVAGGVISSAKKTSILSSSVRRRISQSLVTSEVLKSRSPFIFKYRDCLDSPISSAMAVIGILLIDILPFK